MTLWMNRMIILDWLKKPSFTTISLIRSITAAIIDPVTHTGLQSTVSIGTRKVFLWTGFWVKHKLNIQKCTVYAYNNTFHTHRHSRMPDYILPWNLPWDVVLQSYGNYMWLMIICIGCIVMIMCNAICIKPYFNKISKKYPRFYVYKIQK